MKPIINYLIILTFLFGSPLIVLSQNAEQLYQKGLMQEEGEGNLSEAIDIYNQIVELNNANEAVRAKALLHVGLCYEKMGKDEATKAYQRLVNNFPSQKNEVAIARERLSKLILAVEEITKTSRAPKFTKIKIPTELSWNVALSPNGKELALVSDRKLWKMPLSGNLGADIPGTPVQLNTDGIEVEWSGLSWSRDGKWIAFNDYPKLDDKGIVIPNQGIYIVSSKGGKPKKVIENVRSARVVNYRISLSSEGKKLAFSSIEDNKQHIFSTSVDNVIPRQLAEMEAREPVFSPDGKNIAFVKDKNKGIGEGDLGLWVMDVDGDKLYKLADAGKASSPIWSPDGKLIAFLDYSSGNQISIVPFSKTENTIGKVIRIDAPAGTEEIRLLAGWTPDNKIGALLVSKLEFGLFTLPANGGQAAIILTDNRVSQPRFSRDGSQIYYVATPEEGVDKSYRMFLATVPAKGGKGKPLFTNNKRGNFNQFSYQGGNRVSPDGKWIVSSTWTSADTNTIKVHWPTSKIWKVSVDGEAAIQITNTPGNFSDMSPCWSPDGKKVAFIRFQLVADENEFFGELTRIYTISSLGGEPELLDSIFGKYINSLVWSPDGNKIAYISKEKVTPNKKTLNIIDLNTGVSKAIGEIPSVNVHIELAWSPDSKRIAFNDGDGKVIKIMNLSDGSIEDIETGLVDENIYHLDWSPDGKRFVFGGFKGGQAEFWFMEDFLPLEKLAQKENTEPSSKKMTLQKVWSGDATIMWGSPSPSGEFMTYSDPVTLNLAMRELSTGETKILTNDASENPLQFNMGSVVSPDNKKIAYAWFNNNQEIRLLDIENPQPKVLYANKYENVWPCAWSPNGKTIYARSILNSEGKSRILAINAENGEMQIIKTFNTIFWLQLSVSPDNKFIAYHFPNDKNGNTDIHLISTDGKTESTIVNHPANDQVLGWLPDNNQLLFKSDRIGTWDAWAVKVFKGNTAGEPEKVIPEIGQNASPLGFAKNGTFYYSHMSRKFNGSVLPFDQKREELKNELAKPLLGSIRVAKWSPDGKYIALIKELWMQNKRPLYILDAETGKEQKMIDRLNISKMFWLQDNETILIRGFDHRRESDKNYSGALYTINTKTGEVSELLSYSEYRGREWEIELKIAQLITEGNNNQKNIYFLKNGQLISRELATGMEKNLFKNNNFNSANYSLEPSPNEKYLLFCNENQLFVIPITNPKLIPIVKYITINNITVENNAIWSPDGNYILYSHNTDDGSALWKVSPNVENPREVWKSKFPICSFSFNPDGEEIVITTLNQETEVWKAENLINEVEKILNQDE